jgi:hypothetical protein
MQVYYLLLNRTGREREREKIVIEIRKLNLVLFIIIIKNCLLNPRGVKTNDKNIKTTKNRDKNIKIFKF